MTDKAHGGNGQDGHLVDKLDGGTDKQITGYVTELDAINYINPSTDPKLRKNDAEDKTLQVTNAQSGLEGVIKRTAGGDTAVIAGKETVDIVAEALIEQVMELPDAKKDPKGRETKVQDYLVQAGVSYADLLRDTIGLKGGVKIDQLPDGHPLKTLVNYISTKKVNPADRERFLQRQIVALGTVKGPAVANAFNDITGTNLDPRYATPQQALAAFSATLQAKQATYRANDPNLVYNKKAA